MSSNGQNHRVPEAHDAVDDGPEEDDDFGEFEGFEGGIERMQAQPAPSPWATFPDLLPVQTSPATPAEDGQASSSRNNAAGREAWQPIAAAAAWPGPGLIHDDSRPMPQQMRTLNPPDVSLGTNQAVGGRITPDNVHDAALAVVMDHMDGGLDARLPVAQIDMLNQQLESAEHGRALLEEQVDGLRQRNVELEQQVVSSQAQINDLQARLQRNQETLERRLSELRDLNSADLREDLRRIQAEIAAIKESHLTEKNEIETSRQNLEEMKTGICNRLQNLESNIQREYVEMERRLSKKFDEQCLQVKEAIEAVVQQTAQQVSGSLSNLVCEAVQNSNGGEHQGNNLLQSIKLELEKHKDQQKRVLEEERQRQLITVSSALQSALQHLNSAINEDTKLKDGDIS
ncbi:coiled-coil domain-containing protein 91-like isoform X2 [Uloborus diversus]|uniref:coiled-coil domain-containing protein 91-like isoform X2 n=1 Tax=Uloborus diversus TaxID=327109 RepID=UPI00240A5102|nr:coiled-coil domain-containing protein 91-like isoform X2 [Uloborus diversus]